MLLIISYSLIFLSMFFARTSRFTPLRTLVLFFLLTLSCLNNVAYKIIDMFSGNGIDRAVLYHLWFGLEGAGFGEYISLYVSIGIYVLVVATLFLFLYRSMRARTDGSSLYTYIATLFAIISIIISPTIYDLYTLYHQPELPAAVHTQVDSTGQTVPPEQDYAFSSHYNTTVPTRITTSTPKNLVLIYLEGLEQTYSNQSVFPELTPNLDRLAQKATVFTNIIQIEDVGYTIAGMVASQCGIPLVTATNGNTLNGFDRFLPGATCLGDVLKPHGYHLAYYGGADLTFAGKGLFYTTHKFDEVNGVNELKQIVDPVDVVSWGVTDGALFPVVTKRFDELSANTSTPFVLSMITLETHHPVGVQSNDCASVTYADGKNSILNAVHCSDEMVGQFVDHILASPAANNTIIVIASDHLGLPNKATKLLNSTTRRDRLMIIDPTNQTHTDINTLGSTLDTASTFLPFMGLRGTIGLGHNLLSPSTTESDVRFIHNNTKLWYKDIEKFWQLPTVQKQITIDTKAEQITIDDRHFLLPALISLTPELETSLFFRFSLLTEKDKLLSYAKKEASGNFFYMIEQCQILKQYMNNPTLTDPLPNTAQLCLASGTNEVQNVQLLTENKTLLKQEILEDME